MKQKIIKSYGAAGRAAARKFVENAKCQAIAYWVNDKKTQSIYRMEKLSATSRITWAKDCGGLWWSATLI